MSDIENIVTVYDFESIVEDKSLAFVLFTSETCKPCKDAYDVLNILASSDGLKSSAYCCTILADGNAELCEQFSVTKTPTMVVLKEGRVIGHLVGQSKITLAHLSQFMLF